MASVYKTTDRKGRKHASWRFKYLDHCGKWRYGTGWPDKKKTLEHALTVEAEHRAVRNGEKPMPPEWLRNRNKPIAEVVQEYLDWGAACGGRRGLPWSKDHKVKVEYKLKYWIDVLGLRTLTDILLVKVEAAARTLLTSADSSCGKTVNGYVEALKALCNWSIKRGYLAASPIAGMRKFDDTPQCPHRVLEDDEVRRLLAEAPPARNLLYRVALSTGYRAGELRALKVRDLNPFAPSLRLGHRFTKNRKDAEQPITRELAEELRELSAGKPPDGSLLDMPRKETANENFQRDCAKAGIRRVTEAGKATFHSLRENYINSVVYAGHDLKTIMTLARHGSAQMSMEKYAKPRQPALREAAEAVAAQLDSLITPCCTDVARAAGAENESAVSAGPPGAYGAAKLVSPRGFEPRSPD